MRASQSILPSPRTEVVLRLMSWALRETNRTGQAGQAEPRPQHGASVPVLTLGPCSQGTASRQSDSAEISYHRQGARRGQASTPEDWR